MKKIIIGLVGEIASGKGTVANYLINEHKAESFRFSTPLRDVLNRMHIEINRKNMQTLSTTLRKEFGQDLLAKIIAKDVETSKSNIVVVDGIRRMQDIKYLRTLPEFKLVHISADLEIRFNRIDRNTALKLARSYENKSSLFETNFCNWLNIKQESLNYY